MEEFVIELSPEENLLREVIEPLLESEGYELVRLRLKAAQAKLMLLLFIDTKEKKNGVVMDNLVDVSRLLSDVLDATFDDKSVLKRRYDLEVSSPGLDRPLTKASHFLNAAGEKIKLRLKSETQVGLRGLVGRLEETMEQGIIIEPETQKGERLLINYKDIADANIIFDFAKSAKKAASN